MPHPAILTTQSSTETVQSTYKHVANPTIRHRNVDVQRGAQYRQEPASTSNPIRSDGTRSPAPYFIKRLFFSQGSSLALQSPQPGFWGTYLGPTPSHADCWQELFGVSPATAFGRLHNAAYINRVTALAQVAFLNRLADASGKDSWQLGIAAGEFRETCGMAASLASSLVGAARSIARATRKSPNLVADTLRIYGEQGREAALRNLGGQNTSLLETIVQSWLVKQFGIDPLVNDLFNASVQLQASLADPVRGAETFTTTIRGGSQEFQDREIKVGTAWVNEMHGMSSYLRVRHNVKVGFSAKYRIPVKPTTFQRLGLYNPVLLAEQLTRFSWMADYVTNTSDWLRACMAGQDCRFLEGTRSVVSKVAGLGGYSVGEPGITVVLDPMSHPFVLSTDWFERSILPVVGVLPPFLPAVKNKLNVNKMANSVAALTVLVGSHSRPGPPVIRY